MRVDHLRYLLEIDKHHSISAAAQELYLGQTTLSSIVKSLEQKLGFSIFHRTHNGVQTTPEGEEALTLIWEINCRFEEIKQLASQASMASQPIPITTSPTINSGLALPINQRFLELDPDGNLHFQVVPGENVGPMLIKNEGNIGVTYFSGRDLENYRSIASRYQIHVETLLTDHLYLLVPREHPLAKQDIVSCEQLSHLDFAMLSHYNSADGSLAYSKSFGPGNRYTTFSDVSHIKKAVLNQHMVAVLSGYAIQYDHSVDNSRLKAILLTDTYGDNIMYMTLIHRSDGNLRYQEKLVLQCIKEYFRELPLPPFSPEAKED